MEDLTENATYKSGEYYRGECAAGEQDWCGGRDGFPCLIKLTVRKCGGNEVSASKWVRLPFAPFPGLIIAPEGDDGRSFQVSRVTFVPGNADYDSGFWLDCDDDWSDLCEVNNCDGTCDWGTDYAVDGEQEIPFPQGEIARLLAEGFDTVRWDHYDPKHVN